MASFLYPEVPLLFACGLVFSVFSLIVFFVFVATSLLVPGGGGDGESDVDDAGGDDNVHDGDERKW
jgi:hypothetical protein